MMDFFDSRDVRMTLYALAVFLIVYAVHVVLAKIRRKGMSGVPYWIGAVVCAVWEYVYSSGGHWKHNNGLLGGYFMLVAPVIGVICAAVVSVLIGKRKKFHES